MTTQTVDLVAATPKVVSALKKITSVNSIQTDGVMQYKKGRTSLDASGNSKGGGTTIIYSDTSNMVYAKVTGMSSDGIYTLDLYDNGLNNPSTSNGTALATSICSELYNGRIPNGTIVLVKRQAYKIVV